MKKKNKISLNLISLTFIAFLGLHVSLLGQDLYGFMGGSDNTKSIDKKIEEDNRVYGGSDNT